MSKALLLLIIVLIVVFAIIVFSYLHKRHHEYKLDDIKRAIESAYPEGVSSVQKQELVKAVKKYFHCSSKEAHYIIGVARRKKMIDIEVGVVTLQR